MANMYDVGPVMQGGSGAVNPGSAAFYGMQQELMRRQQQQAAAAEVERQRQLDVQAKAVQDENLAQQKELRAATAEQRTAAAKKLQQEELLSTMTPGVSSPTQSAQLRRAGLGHLILGAPGTPAVAAVPGVQADTNYEGQAAIPEVAAVPEGAPTETFIGGPAQQEKAAHAKFAQEVLNGEHDSGNEGLDQWAKARAQEFLMTGKETGGGPPAGIITPKAAPAEKDAAKYLDIATRQARQQPVTADEAAWHNAYESQHPTEAQKQKSAVQRLNITVGATNERQDKSQLFSMKQKFRDDLKTEDAKLAPDLERVNRAKTVLNSPNFLSDALAAPEVLQIMAGGMGSGLRMTDAELNRVNGAQSKLDQLRGVVAKFGIGTPVTIQAEMRKNMKELIDVVEKARMRHAKLLEETRGKISDADTPEQLDQMVSGFWGKRRETGMLSGAPATSGLPPGVTVTKR